MIRTGLGVGWDGSADITSTEQVPLSFADPTNRGLRRLWDDDDGLAIWSCRFSADGKEVVAGGHGKLFGTRFEHIHMTNMIISFQSMTSLQIVDL